MREWWGDNWQFLRFITILCVVSILLIGGLTYAVLSSPVCHTVYVQTTPVDGKPAMEKVEVCK